MEYCEGGDLRKVLDEKRPEDATDAVRRRWLADIAAGMRYLYKSGVEHRDLKTKNVLLDGQRRRCKVTDFGLSKSEDLNTMATQATMGGGGAKGTPAYMSPELLSENIFTEKGDVYAYAIVIWEVLTGEVPWAGLGYPQIITQVLVKGSRPPLPSDGAADDLVALMGRCWAASPDDRPAFAEITSALAAKAAPPSPAV